MAIIAAIKACRGSTEGDMRAMLLYRKFTKERVAINVPVCCLLRETITQCLYVLCANQLVAALFASRKKLTLKWKKRQRHHLRRVGVYCYVGKGILSL